MKKSQEYFSKVIELLQKASDTQTEAMEKAASMIADSFQKDRWLFVFGTGHSHMLAEEMFYRAGGMARVRPIFETALMLHESAFKSSEMERLSGYAQLIFDDYGLEAGDSLIIASNSGRNSLCVEMAMLAKERGVNVIALTSLNHSSKCTSRDKSGKRLFEIADVVLDNGGCYGDACVQFGDRMAAPTSSAVGTAMLNALECAVIEEMERRNAPIEILVSGNVQTTSQESVDVIKKYRGIIKSL